MTARVLILAGTAEARALADLLCGDGIPTISSLAGRVSRPRVPAGELRVGGFGGPEALAAWLALHSIAAVVDATHPFAAQISRSARQATSHGGVPLLRLERPGWTSGRGDRWTWVSDLTEAAAAVRARGPARVFLTTGRQGLAAFAGDAANWYLIRCVDPPHAAALPRRRLVVLDRGPYTFPGECAMLADHAIDVLVTKDSGGRLTEAKLLAARARSLPVVIVRRPPHAEVPTVATPAEASVWARRHVAAGSG